MSKTEKNSKKVFRRFMSYIKPYWFMIAIAAFGGVIKFTMPMVFPQVMRYFIDDVLSPQSVMSKAQKFRELSFWSLLIIGLYLFIWIPGVYIRHYYAGKVGHKVIFDLRHNLYLHIQRMSSSYFKENQSGSIVSRLINDINLAQNMVGNALTNIWMDGAVIIVLLFVMLKINVILTLVSISVFPIYIISSKKLGRLVKKNSRQVQDELAEMTGELQEKISGYAVVQSFAQEKHEKLRFFKEARKLLDYSIQSSKLNSINMFVVGFLTAFAPIMVIWVSGNLIINNKLTVGEMVVFYSYLGQFYFPINRFSELNIVYSTSMAAIERVFEVFDKEPDVKEKDDAIECSTDLKGEVELKDVSFGYSDKNMILKNISFTVKPGMKVAFVGPSGSGKSTLVSLLPRFYDPVKGTISIDGVDIRDYKLNSLRKNIGMVLQDNILFSGTLSENIKYGNPKAAKNDIVEAAKAANAYDFIMQSPYKFDTEVGESGMKLSGGQKQRIAIARVFVKNPKILILDEATSALDSESENQIQEALDRLMKGRTTFVIAHRLSTVINSDIIMVVDQGEIKEMGSHEELLKKGGLYEYLFNQQFGEVKKLMA